MVREELSAVAAHLGEGDKKADREYAETKSTYERLIPQGTAAFVKELLKVGTPDKRCVCLPDKTCMSPCAYGV